MSEFTPTPFTWHPPSLAGPVFASLKQDDGTYLCPWPDCGHISTGPQGMGRHLTYRHHWQSPLPPRSSHNKTRDAHRKHPSNVRKTEKVTCDYNGCTRVMRQDYKRGHLRKFHHLPEATVEAILNGTKPSTALVPSQRQPKDYIEMLWADDVCQTILEQVAHNDVIPVAAVPAYLRWMKQTDEFLTALYGREPA